MLCLLLESASGYRLLVLTGSVCGGTGHGTCVGRNPALLGGELLQLPSWKLRTDCSGLHLVKV